MIFVCLHAACLCAVGIGAVLLRIVRLHVIEVGLYVHVGQGVILAPWSESVYRRFKGRPVRRWCGRCCLVILVLFGNRRCRRGHRGVGAAEAQACCCPVVCGGEAAHLYSQVGVKKSNPLWWIRDCQGQILRHESLCDAIYRFAVAQDGVCAEIEFCVGDEACHPCLY